MQSSLGFNVIFDSGAVLAGVGALCTVYEVATRVPIQEAFNPRVQPFSILRSQL